MNAALQRLRSVGPAPAAFFGSLLLSAIALATNTLNRDGMLYVRTAEAYLAGGLEAARESFDWLFLPILMAWGSRLTGLGPEAVGQLFNALFMAGTCALLVSCVGRRQPELAWWACLAVLSVIGINEYRHELLREYGCWFFALLAFRLALDWDARPGWLGALAVQAALLVAALFRSEALVLFAALAAWQAASAAPGQRLRRAVMIAGLPALSGLALLWAWSAGLLDGRLAMDLGRFSLERFDAKAAMLASTLVSWAEGNAGFILLAGSLALVPFELVQKLGPFVLPLIFLMHARAVRSSASRHALFAWGFAAHLPVLCVFVADLQFLAGRYVGLSLLMLVPFVAAGLFRFTGRWPGTRLAVVTVAVLLALANAVSTGEPRHHVVEAGRWLAANAEESDTVYIDSRRVAHYARWYFVPLAPPGARAAVERAVRGGRHTLYVLEVSESDGPVEPWLDGVGLEVVRRFAGSNGGAVIVAVPGGERSAD